MSVRAIPPLLALLLCGPAWAGAVKLQTLDGSVVAATTYGEGDQGVILVHEEGGDAGDWDAFARKLASNDMLVVAVDLRGHGASSAPGTPTDADWPKMVADVRAAASWLTQKGATEITAVGAKVGGNLALNAAAAEAAIGRVVMISPGLNINGVRVSGAVGDLGMRPVLLVAGSDDAPAAKAVGLLDQAITGPHETELYPTGSGMRMLNTAPELEALLVSWCNGSWKLASSADAARQDGLRSSDVNDIETTGTRLEDRGK